MIEFGKNLRTAREAKGLSLSQLAESTHMLSQIVDGLEREDFSQIVAPIYGRGFVKLYCEAVGLEPSPFIEQFMALYNGTAAKTEEIPSPSTILADEPTPSTATFGNDTLPPFRPARTRLLAIAGIAGVVILLLILGLRALYHATSGDPVETVAATSVETVAASPADATAEQPKPAPVDGEARQPLPVKPFYAD